MNQKYISKNLSNLSGKFDFVTARTKDSKTFKKTIDTVKSSSKEVTKYTKDTSDKVFAAGQKTIQSDATRNAINYLGTSSREVLSESRKIATNVLINVTIVAAIFFTVNTIFIIYGVSETISNFAYLDLVFLSLLIIGGLVFSGIAAYRCYNYAQFKIGLGIYHLLEAFFKQLIRTSITQVEKFGSEKMKRSRVQSLVKNNGIKIIQASSVKTPWIIRKSIVVLMEFVPFGDILSEITEEAKRKTTEKMEDQAIRRLDSYVAALKPHKNFTTFIGVTMSANIVIMSFLIYWM